MNLKCLLATCIFLCFFSSSFIFPGRALAQNSRWLWLSSGTEPNSSGSEYTAAPNVPSRDYVPATRENAAVAADTSGNLWMYGGGQISAYNKLWRYNTTTGEWTWMDGSSSDPVPSGRKYATGLIDKTGNYWLFGGLDGFNYILFPSHYDLWKFDIIANKWIQVTTESNGVEGVYGTQGVPSPDNHPGRRSGSVGWTDNDGNLWTYGGYGYNYRTQSYSIRDLNDVWKYNVTTNQWTWMAGDVYGYESDHNYGRKGIPSPDNFPGSRNNATYQTDGKGTLWLFGSSSGKMNDLWKYNIATHIWTWMAGDTISNPDGNNGVYGTKGVAAETNTPGYRFGMCSFIDSAGNFWMYGGRTTRYQSTNSYIGFFNDLWKFDISINQWVWMDGDSTTDAPRVYNTNGASDPGGRMNMASWTDNKGKFWMFGGFTEAADGSFAYLNDLWSYTPALQALPITLISFTGTVSSSSAILNWTTSQSVNNKGFEVQKSKDGQTFSDIGFVASTFSGQYSFTDASLSPGTSLYRLKIIDANGSFTYSPVVNLNYSSFNWSVMNRSSNVYLQLQLDKQSSVSIQVVAANGTVLQSINKGKIEKGSYSIPLTVNNTSPGLYIIRLLANGKSDSKKIIIGH